MKRFLSFLTLALTLFTAMADDDPRAAAAISFPETSHDFGVILEDNGPVSYEFHFTNDGTAPLVILSAKAQCGCTRPQYPSRPVNPGKSGEIKVTFIPATYRGEFTKEVTVRTNDPANKRITLKITGVVVPGSQSDSQ